MRIPLRIGRQSLTNYLLSSDSHSMLNKNKVENTYFVKGLIELEGTFTGTKDSPK